MKKIGIMTWFLNNNYGSSLQAFSLEKAIKKLGYSAEIINYKPLSYASRDVKSFKHLQEKVHRKLFYKRVNQDYVFEKFRTEQMEISEQVNTYPELRKLNSKYDAFICGSDQIWSPLSFNEKFYLNFVDNNKIISYAPSLGVSEIKNEFIKNRMKELISRFSYLSVRELQGQKIIKELSGKEAELVLDPTLLLSKNNWVDLTSNVSSELYNCDYILCYFLGNSNRHYKSIIKFAKKNKLKILNIPVFKRQLLSKYNVSNIGPLEFVKLIKNAKYVFTDSYHGTIFSINLNVPFLTFKRFKDNDKKSENSRLDSIFKLLELNELFVYELKSNFSFNIDYEKVNLLLNSYREKSLNYLKNSIDNVNNCELFEDKKTITECCTGCSACKQACPKNAIEIREDDLGFQRSFIDADKCINCGLCKKICPIVQLKYDDISNMKNLYSFKSCDKEILLKSSSGGFSHAVASLLNSEYYICGCYYDKSIKSAVHILIKPCGGEKLSKLQGSKYIQSATADSFAKILQIASKEKVAFFGTPCQVAGLDSLLRFKKMRSNVLLIELICHGVPSKYLWNSYLKEISRKYKLNDNNIDVSFRNKKYGWSKKCITLSDGNKEVSIKEANDKFYKIFNKRYVNNHSCYECPYRYHSAADIKIGDYWGNKFAYDNTGVSMVITMTESGEEILNKLKNLENVKINIEPKDDYFNCQSLINPQEPLFKSEMLSDMKNGKSLDKILKKYCSYDELAARMKKILHYVKRGKNEK